MPEMTKKLDRFTAAILAEATAETERTLDDLKKKRAAALDQAEDRILLEAFHYIKNEVAAIRAETGRSVSRHMLDNNRALYLRREEISQEVFRLVRGRLEEYTAAPAYAGRLAGLYRQALDTLKGADDVRVYLRPADLPRAEELRRAVPGVNAAFEAGDFTLGGLVAESASLGLRVDATFDNAMEELSGHFAELFGLSLSDDA